MMMPITMYFAWLLSLGIALGAIVYCVSHETKALAPIEAKGAALKIPAKFILFICSWYVAARSINTLFDGVELVSPVILCMVAAITYLGVVKTRRPAVLAIAASMVSVAVDVARRW